MSYVPDPFSKMIKIPIEIKKGNIEFYFEGPLPELKDGTLGDLLIPAYAVTNSNLRKLLSEERKIPLLKKDTILFVQVSAPTLDNKIIEFEAIPEEYGIKVKINFVPIVIEEPLYLYLRGTKHPTLSNVKCKTTADEEINATSLNHIYTLISQRYEINRISHTGNVFKKIYYNDKDAKCLLPIERFRRKREILFDNRFFNDGT